MHEILLAKDRAYMILATDVTGADHPDVGRVLEVAAKLGIVYFRMGYFQYKKDTQCFLNWIVLPNELKNWRSYVGSWE